MCGRESFWTVRGLTEGVGIYDRVLEGEMLTDRLFNGRILYERRGDPSKV